MSGRGVHVKNSGRKVPGSNPAGPSPSGGRDGQIHLRSCERCRKIEPGRGRRGLDRLQGKGSRAGFGIRGCPQGFEETWQAIGFPSSRLPPKKSSHPPRNTVPASSGAFRIFLPIRGLPVLKNFPATMISIAAARERTGSSIRFPMWVSLSVLSRFAIERKSTVKDLKLNVIVFEWGTGAPG